MKQTNQPLTEAVYYILLALQEPLHGYGIIQEITSYSQGRLSLSAGTLYGAISSLLEKGWIAPWGEEEGSGGRRKLYRLTEAGRMVLKAELDRLTELTENGKRRIK